MPTSTKNSLQESLRISVKVKPNSKNSKLEKMGDQNVWTAWLKSPPVDGKANQELVALIANHFSCKKKSVSIKQGRNGRLKLIEITSD
jgi:uncharacterized protein